MRFLRSRRIQATEWSPHSPPGANGTPPQSSRLLTPKPMPLRYPLAQTATPSLRPPGRYSRRTSFVVAFVLRDLALSTRAPLTLPPRYAAGWLF